MPRMPSSRKNEKTLSRDIDPVAECFAFGPPACRYYRHGFVHSYKPRAFRYFVFTRQRYAVAAAAAPTKMGYYDPLASERSIDREYLEQVLCKSRERALRSRPEFLHMGKTVTCTRG